MKVRLAIRLHPDRAAGGHRHHRRPDRPAAAGRAGGPRGGPPRPVRQQPQADRPGPAQLPRRPQHLPDGARRRRLVGTAYGDLRRLDELEPPVPCCSRTWSRRRSTTRPTSDDLLLRPIRIADADELHGLPDPDRRLPLPLRRPGRGRATSTTTRPASAPPSSRIGTPASGLFSMSDYYGGSRPTFGMRDATDGSSNTIAFGEMLVGSRGPRQCLPG